MAGVEAPNARYRPRCVSVRRYSPPHDEGSSVSQSDEKRKATRPFESEISEIPQPPYSYIDNPTPPPKTSRFLRIVAPILQTPRALALRIFLRLLLLRQVPLAVRHDAAHVVDVVLVVLVGVLFGVLFEDGDDFAATEIHTPSVEGLVWGRYSTFRGRWSRRSRRLCSSRRRRRWIALASL